MAYSIDSGIWSSVFAVPTEIVDQHIKLCGPVSLKVLLLLLRHGGMMDASAIARLLGQSVADIQDAVNYWIALGIIRGDTTPLQSEAEDIPEKKTVRPELSLVSSEEILPISMQPKESGEQQQVTRVGKTRQRLSTEDINKIAKTDANVRSLLQEAQSVLGRELTPIATDTIVSLYSYYGMQADLILMLIHFCVSQGLDSMRQIERTAAIWMEKGIDTHEKAEREILRETEAKQVENKIKSMFGIKDRKLITSECKYINQWTNGLKMDDSLIQLAFERTIELTEKLSFSYINSILVNWHNEGIKTPAEAMKTMYKKPATKKAAVGGREPAASYDMDAVENMITYGSILE